MLDVDTPYAEIIETFVAAYVDYSMGPHFCFRWHMSQRRVDEFGDGLNNCSIVEAAEAFYRVGDPVDFTEAMGLLLVPQFVEMMTPALKRHFAEFSMRTPESARVIKGVYEGTLPYDIAMLSDEPPMKGIPVHRRLEF